MLTLIVAALAVQASDPPIHVVGHAWAPFISPMGEPFRARSTSEDTLAKWFVQADRNADGAVTTAEMQDDAARFFATLDVDKNDEIDAEELVRYEWDVAPEIQVNSRWRRTASDAQRPKQSKHAAEDRQVAGWHGGGVHDILEGAARYALLNIPEPVAAADTDFNRATSLAEFKQAAVTRFQLLDRRGVGWISLAEFQAMKAELPSPGQRIKRDKNAKDARIGIPVPAGN